MTRDLGKVTVGSVSSHAPRRAVVLDMNGPAPTQRILIVDDEPAIRRLLCDVFASEGYQVSQAANGEQALQQLQLVRPNIVVVDLMMMMMTPSTAACPTGAYGPTSQVVSLTIRPAG
jgi:CheY-like chemotaxis protein